MGSSLSSISEQAAPNRPTRQDLQACLSPFERLSLKKKSAVIGDSLDALLAELAVLDVPRNGVLVRMADKFTPNGLLQNLGLAVCWLDGRLASQLGISEYEWRHHIFEAAAVAEVGGEAYIPFQELVDLVQLLLSAFDSDPQDQLRTKIDLVDPSITLRLLEDIKSPAVRFAQFNSVIESVPYLLAPLANIWDRLLYDAESTKAQTPSYNEISVERDLQALLFAVIGPKLFTSLMLYQGTTKGFSMRAFEFGVTKWPSSTILLVSGHQPRNFTKWDSKPKEIDKIVPRFHDVPVLKARKVVFALLVDDPWKASYKHCFGQRPVLLQLEPEFRIWPFPASTVFMSPTIGLGVGLTRPPSVNETAKGIIFFIDSCMEYGVLRSLPDSQNEKERFEYRFYVDQVEVLGCGTQHDLEIQRYAWAWEDAEATRRRTVNVQEDRALLEMAGIVGQYSH